MIISRLSDFTEHHMYETCLGQTTNGPLEDAANALYDAGYWTCDRPVDELKLWTDLQDVLNRKPGGSPKPIDQKETI